MTFQTPVPWGPDVNAMRTIERRSFMRAATAALVGRRDREAEVDGYGISSVCRRMVGIEREPAVFRPSAGRRGLREAPISCNKTSGHTRWPEVERPQLPAGLLRSPALVDLGGYHGHCLWPRRSVRSGRVSQDFRSPHAGSIPKRPTRTPPPPSAGRTDAHGREQPVASGQVAWSRPPGASRRYLFP
jgi:hypothetical protein